MTANGGVAVRPVQTKKELKQFILLPWSIYGDDPNWVPPLRMDMSATFNPKKNPFYEHARMDLFLAYKDGQPAGRVVGIVDDEYISFQNEPIAFFGYFESINDQAVADALVDHLRAWARDLGHDRIRGPLNPSSNDTLGLLIDGFDKPPRLMMPYNPPYYLDLLTGTGLIKCKDLFAYYVDEATGQRLEKASRRIQERLTGLKVRPIDMNNFAHDLTLVREVYNDAWSDNWGFTPITEAEINHVAKQLKSIVVPDLVRFAEYDGQTVGIIVGLPDYNQVLKRVRSGRMTPLTILKFLIYKKKIDLVRVMMMGVKKKYHNLGIDVVLIDETCRAGEQKGFLAGELSWILEDNMLMRRGIERVGGAISNTYRLFENEV